MKDIRESVNDTLKYLGFLALVVIVICLLLPWPAEAITPPAITQPKPGILRFTWTPPSGQVIGSYRLYLSNETAAITVPSTASSYDYMVPIGYTIKTTDVAAISTVDGAGNEGLATPSIPLPAGITSPKPLIGAPTSFSVVRAPN